MAIADLVESVLAEIDAGAPSVTIDAADFYRRMGTKEYLFIYENANRAAQIIASTGHVALATVERFIDSRNRKLVRLYLVAAKTQEAWRAASTALVENAQRELSTDVEEAKIIDALIIHPPVDPSK